MPNEEAKYRIEYFMIGNGHEPNTVVEVVTKKTGTAAQIGDVLEQLKKIISKEQLKLDDIIVYKMTRVE